MGLQGEGATSGRHLMDVSCSPSTKSWTFPVRRLAFCYALTHLVDAGPPTGMPRAALRPCSQTNARGLAPAMCSKTVYGALVFYMHLV